MIRLAHRGRARGGRALTTLLLAVGGLAACGPEAPDAAVASSTAAVQAAPAAVPGGKAECRRWTTCVPENPCHTGWVTGCRKNEPICTDIGGWLSNGTACGTDAVCFMGECEPCAAGQSCPILGGYGSPDACRAGQIFCDTGQPVCRDVGPVPDGTDCSASYGGGPWFCKAGSCSYCVEGWECAPPEKPCHTGVVTACATTGGTCEDTGGVRQNGTMCGPDADVCRDGECVACPGWQSCTPQEPCFESGWTDCSSGWPVCVPSVQKPDGTPCDGGACFGGQCVQPCVPDQPCTPWNACYSGTTVCWDAFNGYCQERDPLPDGTSCGDGQVCRGGSCNACGPGSWCQSPDPCYGQGTLSCATGLCEPAPPAFGDGWSCGAGGETCQSAVCTDDADPRLFVRSLYGSLDLTGTSWARCTGAGEGTSRRVTRIWDLQTESRVIETFATPDCGGEALTRTTDDNLHASAGDRYVTWTGGTPPPGVWIWSMNATAVHLTGVHSDGTPVDLKMLLWVDDYSYPRRMFMGDASQVGADGYPLLLAPAANPFTEVIPPCVPDQPCTPWSACFAGRTVCWDQYNGYCEQREPLPDGASCGESLVCSNGNCISCGSGASCQSPDPCWESATLSCATGVCEPQPPAAVDGLTCGVGGETCQGGACTPAPGADPWVRSTNGAVDLAGTTWFNCMTDEPEPGMSRMRVDTYVAGGITHHEVVFTSSLDCTGPTDPALALTITGSHASAGDRLVTWAGGSSPWWLPWQLAATAVHIVAPDSPIGPIDFKDLAFVDDSVWPRQLYQSEKDRALLPDGYPSLLEGSRPMAEVLGCEAGAPCTPAFTGR